MFSQLTEGLSRAFRSLSGQSHFTEENTKQAIREIRLSLIEADVALPVITAFIEKIKQKILGEEVAAGLKADQALIKIVHDELVHVLGTDRSELDLKTQPPAIFLVAGLQGSGKTTSVAKLARYLKESEEKKVMVVSLDIYRPAAIEQLKILADQLDIHFFPATTKDKPLDIIRNALDAAKKQYMDIIIFDTAGRLHIDKEMMDEIKTIHAALNPIETLFVVDSMTGQDAANTAKAFHEALPLTGVILTKTDGDARGGAALSVKEITGKPIKFLGTGEKIDALEPFYPERLASRILGMGDILSLVEEMERKVDKKASEKLAKKLKKGRAFDMEDYRQQLMQVNQMGGLQGLVAKLPGLGQIPQQALDEVGNQVNKKAIAIINSMTPKERRVPKIIVGSRKKRIAMGSGTQIPDVNRLLKQFSQIETMMLKLNKPGGMKQLMRMAGKIPGFKDFMPPFPKDE